MRPVSIKLKDMGIANIQLGFVGENNATQVVFDCKEIFNENPYAVQLLVVTPPEGTTYEVTTARIGDGVVWNVSELDTAYAGDGSIQLVFTDGNTVIKTYNANTTILEAQVPSGTAPATALNWIQDAEAWAKGTRGGRAVENDDPTYQNNSKYYSQQIVDMASDSEAYAKGTRNGEAVESDDPAYHNNSKYYAESIADTASDSEAYAAGTRGGEAVDEDDPAYHNNAAYYNDQAALEKAAAQAAAETASAAYNVNLLAANYDATKTYAVGEYVIYSGGLKRCIVPITTAEAWTSAHWEDVTVGKDVTALKSALTYDEENINDLFERLGFVGDITTTNLLNESALTQSKMVDYSGSVVDAPNNTWYVTDLLSIGNVTELFTTYRLANMALIACYDASENFIGIITTNSTGKERLVQNNDYWKVVLYPGTAKIRMNLRSTWIGSSATTRQMLTKYYYPSTYIGYGESKTSLPSTIAAKADYMYKYGIRSLGLFGNTTNYNDCDTLPVNSYVCFYSTGATEIAHRPGNAFTSILEVFTVSTSNTLANGTVQIGIVRDNENNHWAYVRSYIGSVWRDWNSLNTNEKTITVRTSGGTYTSVVDAIKYTMDNPPTKETPVIIDVGAGTFDMTGVADLVEAESIDQFGLFLMPYVTLKGKGRDKTILSFEYDGENDDVMSKVSALNIVYESALKDMKIVVKNIRYVVHADYALSTQAQDDTNTLLRDNTFIMENAELVHEGFDSDLNPSYKVPSAWGQGLRTNLIRKFINCRFIAYEAVPWFCHDRIETSKGCQLFFDGCEFIPHDNSAGLRFVSWGSDLLHIVNIKNCLVRTFVSLGVKTNYNADAKIDYLVKASDLDALIVEDTTNDSDKKMNFYNYGSLMCINKTNGNLTKFTPVKILTYNNAVVNTRNGIQGIALHNASANEMVMVQIAGAVAIATEFTSGTRIGYSNGAWVEDANGFLVVMNSAFCRFV